MTKLFILLTLLPFVAIGQLPNGSTAPDFSSNDILGNPIQLYSDFLNQGKPVIMDISATWCSPCWNYHQSNTFLDAYNSYGVSGSNEIGILFIEGDPGTDISDLLGTTTNSQGDWISGTPYPIIDDESIANLYQISYYPTIFAICPNYGPNGLTVHEIGQPSFPDIIDDLNTLCSTTVGSNNPSSNSGIIFSEDFSGGLGQFTVFTDPGSPVSWQHTTFGHVGSYPSAALQSTTAGNGWMIADSDAYGSQAGAQEYTEFISPIIDCSMYPNIVLQFEQMYRRWQADTCIVMTSNDAGATWSGKHYINSTIDVNGNWVATIDQSGTDNPDLKQINLSADIGGSSQAMFKFVWQGMWDYGWQIDDVVLMEQPDNDLILEDFALNMTSSLSGGLYRDFYGHVPSNQITNAQFGFQVNNFGGLEQPNVTTTLTTGSWTDSENHGLIAHDSSFFVNHINGYMPTSVGQHDFIYTVNSDSTDATPSNNESALTVFITDTVYNAFGTGNNLGSIGTGYFTGGDDGFKMANMYEIETGDELTSVTLGLRTNGFTMPGGLVQVSVFDTTGFFSAGIENPIIYSDFYTITVADTINGFSIIPIPTTYLGSTQDRNLDPGAYYISVECYNNAGANEIRILDDLTVERDFWSSMVYIPGEQWYTNGNAFHISANFGTWNGLSNIYGCTDSTANNYDSYATVDDGSCCYGTTPTLQVYTNNQCGIYAQNMGWELQDDNGSVLASGGWNAGEQWMDYTYYDYCLPITDSCTNYNLVLTDNNYYGWNACSQATALVTSSTGDTLLYVTGNGNFYSQNYSLSGAVQGCTDPLASNYDPNAVCDDGSCCYGTTPTLQVYTNDQCGYHAQNMGWELQDDNGSVLASGGWNAGQQWMDYTYYDYCLPITDSCTNYNLVLTDNNCWGWNNCSQASALVTSSTGDTLLYVVGNGNFCSQNYSLSGAVQGCTDPLATNYDPNAVCDDGSCCYSSPIIDITNTNWDFYGEWYCSDPYSLDTNIQNWPPASVTFSADTGVYEESGYLNDFTWSMCGDSLTIIMFDIGIEFSAGLQFNSNIPYFYGTWINEIGDGGCFILSPNDSSLFTVVGCTDSIANNYNPLAVTDDGSCMYCDLSISVQAQNIFTQSACDGLVFVNASSSYSPFFYTIFDINNSTVLSNSSYALNLCAGVYLIQVIDSVGCYISDTIVLGDLYGCTDPTMYNYDPLANIDDGSCLPFVYGCTDSSMYNYNPLANTNDGSCVPYIYGCTDSTAYNFDSSANTNDGSCLYCDLDLTLYIMDNSFGMCDGWALSVVTSSNLPIGYLWSDGSNMNSIINLCSDTYNLTVIDDVGCMIDTTFYIGGIFGCTDSNADNYDSSATADDGSCAYCSTFALSIDSQSDASAAGSSDGTAVVSASGGTSPYNITWPQNPNSLSAGTYTVTATDAAGCTASIDVTIDEPSTAVCSAPTGLNTYDVVHTRATFNFTSTGADYYKIRVKENGGAWQVITQLGTATGTPGGSTKTKYFLTADASYEWQVRAWCIDGSVSDWSSSAFFNTLAECPNATNQFASDIEAEWAVLNWDAPTTTVAGVNYYLARIQEDGASSWNIVTPGNGGTDNFKLKGQLIPGATYNFETRTWCNTGDTNNWADPYYKSDWGGSGLFTTIPCPVQTFNLYTSNVNATTQFFGADFIADGNVPYDHFTLRFREVGATAWQFRSITAAHIAAGGRNVGGLTTGVDYEWGIRTFCGTGSTWKSPWESGPNFVAGSSARLAAPVTALEVYPNPSRDIFNVSFTSEQAQAITVKVVNMIGEVMYSESLEEFKGSYENGIDLIGKAKGVYFLEITTNTGGINKKIVLQ